MKSYEPLQRAYNALSKQAEKEFFALSGELESAAAMDKAKAFHTALIQFLDEAAKAEREGGAVFDDLLNVLSTDSLEHGQAELDTLRKIAAAKLSAWEIVALWGGVKRFEDMLKELGRAHRSALEKCGFLSQGSVSRG